MTDLMRRADLRTVPSDPACAASRHRTCGAYRKHGCRCPEAILAYEDFRNRHIAYGRARRRARAANRATRRTDGGADPRQAFDGPRRQVSRINLLLLCSGFIDSPTTYERMAAVQRLTGRANPAGTGLMTVREIAARIGCSPRAVQRYQRMPAELRERRTARRLADAQWRAWRKHGNGW